MEQKIYFNGKETTQEFINNYIKENGGTNCKLEIEYNNAFIKYSTNEKQKENIDTQRNKIIKLNQKQIERLYEIYIFEDWEEIQQAEFNTETNELKITYLDKKDNITAIYEPNTADKEDEQKINYILKGK